MTIKTASLREINKLPKTTYKVLITRYFPFWFKGLKKKIDEWLPILAPSKDLLKDFKEEMKRVKNPKSAWIIVKYESRFRRQILHNSKALEEMRRLKRISRQLKGKRVVYLICHEPTEDYCHRRLVKELMRYELGN